MFITPILKKLTNRIRSDVGSTVVLKIKTRFRYNLFTNERVDIKLNHFNHPT